MPKSMFDIIKKQNGERFAKAIRNYDNGIFDIPNIDKIVKYAGREAEPIMNYLVSLKNVQIEEMSVHRDPIDLLAMAGYDAYVADTLNKQNAIKKYFAHGEELCTFHDPYRFRKYYIINAVRKDVNKIRRAKVPQREDEYGTSVISIQVLKSGGFISIKNRYNHTVQNPDNTLNSNPDNIIPGLSDAIKHYFNVDFSAQKVHIPRNYLLINGCICKYNQELGNKYFGVDFYIQDGKIHELDNNCELMLGNGLILNLATKKVTCMVNSFDLGWMDTKELTESIEELIKNKNINIKKAKDGTHSVFADNIHILDVLNGMITFINAPNAKSLCLRDIKLHGDLDFSNVQHLDLDGADLSECDDIKFNPNAKSVKLAKDAVLAGNLNFANVERLAFGYDHIRDFSYVTGITLPKTSPNVTYLTIQNANNLSGNVDFGMLVSLKIYDSNISNVNIKFNPGANIVALERVIGLPDVLDMHEVRSIVLASMDFSWVKKLRLNPNAYSITIQNIYGLSGSIDFAKNTFVYIQDTDLLKTDIKFGNIEELHIQNCKNLHGAIDLRNVSKAYMEKLDLSDITSLKMSQKTKECYITDCIGLHGDLDFSGIKSITLWRTDLSKVHSIKFNPNGAIYGLKPKDKLRFALINGIDKIKQKFSKQQKVIKNESRKM